MTSPTQPSATPRTLEAAGHPSNDWHATADRLFIEAQKLETELGKSADALAAAKATNTQYEVWLKAASDRIEADTAELARLRAEVSAVQAQHLHEIDELAAQAKIMNSLRAEVEHLRESEKAFCEDRNAQKARAERAELESAGRLKVLNEKAEELRKEWQRAENAEAQLAAAQADAESLRSAREIDGENYVQKCAELAAARKDSERLDYLWDNADDIFSHDGRVLIWLSSQNIREAIDAAMTTSNHKTT